MDGLNSLKNSSIPVWKTYLYQLQLQAPNPKPIQCQKNVPNRPSYYGLEYHGMISRQESEQLLGNEDGNYLVRESNNPPSSCTLAIKFNNETKNYKVYYDGAFYVGEKRFDNINDLVHDGLISFYIEKHASNYIAMMAEESNYAESPYVASRTALLARQKREPPSTSAGVSSTGGVNNGVNGSMMAHHTHSAVELVGHLDRRVSPPQSIHSSFQRQHQNGGTQSAVNLVMPPQHSFSYSHQSNNHQNQIQQHFNYQQQQQQQQYPNFNHNNNHQQQQMASSSVNSNGGTLTNSSMSSSTHHHNHHDSSNTTSGVSTLMSQMMMDKENRQSFGGSSSESNNSSRFVNSLNVAKSNAIFDRFDIMNSEKQHRFKPQNFKGPHWCDFCLNFMWGLVSQGVKCQDCGFQAHKKCSERTPPDCEPQMRFIKRIFGVDLTTLVKAMNTIRPVLVEKCVEEIERRKGAIETEGLYRVSGFSDAVDELKMAFDRGENVNFDEFKYNDIHIICSLLKLFLRQLPIPLITFDIYNRLIDTFNTAHLKSNLIESIKACVVELPPAHYLTLKYLMEHLVKVAQYSSKNQMSFENLAIVFGPTLMRSINPDPVLALKNTHKEQKITELLIANYTNIFEK